MPMLHVDTQVAVAAADEKPAADTKVAVATTDEKPAADTNAAAADKKPSGALQSLLGDATVSDVDTVRSAKSNLHYMYRTMF